MLYTEDEVFEFVEQEDVKFIRLAFCDCDGVQKNISIMPSELKRAFKHGISFDAAAVKGFGKVEQSDLFLFPLPETLNVLPWRPSRGRVVRMFCDIKYPDGRLFEKDSRYILKQAVKEAQEAGCRMQFGSEFEFYIFKTDENGDPTKEPFDHAGYMDVFPDDKGETVRRDICLLIDDMGIHPESSHHEEGPSQHEIDFRYSDPVSAADNAVNFKSAVYAATMNNGLCADFSPKPLENESGNGMHINISVICSDGKDRTQQFMAGILEHIKEITAFLNPHEDSYRRLGERKAPKYITWSPENRSPLIRIPAAKDPFKRIELRSPDAMANPYIAYALLIYAGLDGIKRELTAPAPVNVNLFSAPDEITGKLDRLPGSLGEAREAARNSAFIKEHLPESFCETWS